MNKAYIFPGQGSQYVGMGKNHYSESDIFKQYCDRANELLSASFTSVLFEGPEEQLRQTRNTQPAIFLHSVALFASLDAHPGMVAGHSLGEFSALVAAKAIGFEDGLLIVRKRGELMHQAGIDNPGTMAAIIGMEDDAVENVCAEATQLTGKEVVAANYNSPGQLVISGYMESVEKAVELAQAMGCRMAKILPVSGAFHSVLMRPALEGLKEQLENVEIKKPVCPVYCNYTALPTTDPEELRENLLNQLLNPVRWTQTIQNMHKSGATEFIEVGPGKVLQGLVKRTLSDANISGIQ